MIINLVFWKNQQNSNEENEEVDTKKIDKLMPLNKIKDERSLLQFLWNELAKEKKNWKKEKEREKERFYKEIKYERDML